MNTVTLNSQEKKLSLAPSLFKPRRNYGGQIEAYADENDEAEPDSLIIKTIEETQYGTGPSGLSSPQSDNGANRIIYEISEAINWIGEQTDGGNSNSSGGTRNGGYQTHGPGNTHSR